MRQLPTFFAIICLIIAASARAEQPRKLAKDIKPDAILSAAQEMGRAMIAQDFGKLADFTFPKIVAGMGGREKMIEKLKAGVEEMKNAGYGFNTFHVDAPTAIADAGNDIVAVVPQSLEMTVPGGKLTAKSYLIGLSSDQGQTWTFIDGAGIDAKSLKTLLPNFPKDVKLPAKQQSVFEPNK
jgi:hypothetical protein